ncbi:hypothetical protein Aau02nite_31810 [Amorphoplanes auranticolor]|uniref:Phytanoyl-CoA dioxygenase PhyH n=2 Tax=Actinoplanes auranticolor TaxID=47988 RepID=A0A919SBE3_9ACTN|nr:hypothetical protein Aau02nite_31810 [Actinoplanes auranticolor]
MLRLPGAIPGPEAAAMVDRIWDHLHRSHGVIRDRRQTWPAGQITGLRAVTDTPEFQALGSATVRGALDDLLRAGRWQPPRRWGRLLGTFPSPGRQWTLPDGAAWHNDFVPLQPGPALRAVQLFTILHDLPARGGGTLVVTGSHHLVTRYITGTEGTRIDDVDLRVVELSGRPGDVFVMHCDTLHAAAPNSHEEPRMMATTIVPAKTVS